MAPHSLLVDVDIAKPDDNSVLIVVDAFDTLIDSATVFTASASAVDTVLTNTASMFPALAKNLAKSGSDVTVMYTGSLEFDQFKFDKIRKEFAKAKIKFTL